MIWIKLRARCLTLRSSGTGRQWLRLGLVVRAHLLIRRVWCGQPLTLNVSALAFSSHQRLHIMPTTSLHSSHASSGHRGWASAVVACAAGASSVLRGWGLSVLAKGICAAQLVPSFKSGSHGHRGFGRVKSAAVCTGTVLVWGEGGAPAAVATANVRPNPALKRDVPQAARPLAPR